MRNLITLLLAACLLVTSARSETLESLKALACEKISSALELEVFETGAYIFTKKFYSWKDARQHCQKLGLDLAVTDSKDEIKLVFEAAHAKFNETERFWTVGTDRGRAKGTFFWGPDHKVCGTLWAAGQPGDAPLTAQSDSCVTLRKTGLGVDACADQRRAVCKLVTTPSEST